MLLRSAVEADLPAIQAIYAHWVTHGTSSFELEAPNLAEMFRRHTDVVAKGLPYLGSLGLHNALGFRHIGTLQSTGWKFDRWLDTNLMQCSLGAGDTMPAVIA